MNKWLSTFLCFGIMFFNGCYLFDEYTMSEHIPSNEKISEIEPLELTSVSSTKPRKEPNQPAAESPKELSLTIEESRAHALRNNLDLKVSLFTPKITDESIQQAQARFEPLFLSQFNFAKSDTPAGTPISVTLDSDESQNFNSSAGLQFPLKTGGQLQFNSGLNRVKSSAQKVDLLDKNGDPVIGDDDEPIQVIIDDPRYATDLSMTLTQPLLRGAGVKTNTHEIRVAVYDSKIERARTRLEVIRVLAAVDRVYWRLYAARREQDVRKQQYKLANEQLNRAIRMEKEGQSAEIEVIRAEEALAKSWEEIIKSDNAVRDRERELKQVLNISGIELESDTTLLIDTQPNPLQYEINTQALIKFAMKHRMELLVDELTILKNNSTIDLQKNGLLPLLSLNYTYNINGLGFAASDSYDLLSENRFVDHQIGLSLEIPLGNKDALSKLRTAILQRQQNYANKEKSRLTVKKEVLDAADQLQTNWQRVVASGKSAMLAERTYKAERRQFELGLQTSTQVLDAQTRFADAQLAEIQAITEYQISQVDLAFASGSLIGAAQIVWNNEIESLSQ